MLSAGDNELLTRVGPDTPMGNVFRQYWLPVLLSSELPDRDGRTLRVRVLGEDMVAFRDTQGRVGLPWLATPPTRPPAAQQKESPRPAAASP